MPNIYYDPEKFGLKIFGDIDWSDGFYHFDQTVVWQDDEGRLYYADDSGCSCPSPFEGKGVDDLTRCTDIGELQAHLEERLNDDIHESQREKNEAAMVNLLGRLRQTLVLVA